MIKLQGSDTEEQVVKLWILVIILILCQCWKCGPLRKEKQRRTRAVPEMCKATAPKHCVFDCLRTSPVDGMQLRRFVAVPAATAATAAARAAAGCRVWGCAAIISAAHMLQ